MATYQEQIEASRLKREEAARAAAENMARDMSPRNMSPEQITNFRHVLSQIVGPYALLMPGWMVEHFRDELQKRLNEEAKLASRSDIEEKP